MKKFFYLFAVITASVLAFSCTTKELDNLNDSIQKNEVDKDEQPQPVITITASIPEDIDTKITITEETDYSLAKLAWEEDDQITVIGNTTTSIFEIDPNSISDDGKRANFNLQQGQPTPGGSSFTILYHPENPTSVEVFDGKSYDGQVQNGNGSLAHLNYAMKLENVDKYDVVSFSSDWATSHSGSFVQNSVLQLLLKLPEDVEEVYSIYVKDDGTFAQTLWLKDGSNVFAAPNTKQVIKGYMMVPDMDLVGNLTVRVETEDGAYEDAYPLNITDWTGGAQYTIQKNMSLSAVTGAMEIHAACAQDILQFKAGVIVGKSRFNGSTVTLEKDIDMAAAGTWSTSIPSTFEGTFCSASSEDKKTISGINATAPLFETISAKATLKNMILNGTFAYSQPESGNDYFGSLAKTCQGKIINVIVNANVSLNAVSEARENLIDLGGLIGRANNPNTSITGCAFNGSIEVPSGYSNSSASGLRLGGLIGYISQALTVSECSFGGTIKCEGDVSAPPTDPTDASKHPALTVGGIVGKLQRGTISGCFTIDADDNLKPSVDIAGKKYKGSIFLKSSADSTVAVGGIAGFCYDGSSSITGCTNATTILTNITIDDAENVYLFSGGIVGLNRKEITDCSNSGAQQHLSTSRLQSIGGLIGRHHGTLTVSSAVKNNGGSISVYSSPSVGKYQIATGGIIGYTTVAIDGISSANFSNSGSIDVTHSGVKCDTPDADNDYGISLGGIVGYATANIQNASNSGNLTFVCKNAGSTEVEGGSQYIYLGGIVGKVKGASYSSRVDVGYCSNSGTLTHNPTSTAPNSATCFYQYNYLGGIAGYAEFVNIKGDSSNKTTNSGNITGGCTPNETSYHDNTFFIGGIVGYLNGRNSSIAYCNLTESANVNNNHWTNRSVTSTPPMCGGIAGVIYGTSSNHVTVSNCSVASTVTVTGRRGCVGGIVGWARGGTISDCTVGASMSTSSYALGGIVGRTDYGDVSSCTFNGVKLTSTQAQRMGGIVGMINNNSCTVDGCSSYVNEISTTTNASGAIAGTSVTGSKIKSCHYKSALSICGDANFTPGTGAEANVADL